MTNENKVFALLKKTVANGCTSQEQESAVAKAREIVKANGLNAANFKWPDPPKAAAPAKAKKVVRAKTPRRAKTATKPKGTESVSAQKLAMAQRPEGVSMEELLERFGTLPHSLRAALSVESRKQGVVVRLVEGRYKIV